MVGSGPTPRHRARRAAAPPCAAEGAGYAGRGPALSAPPCAPRWRSQSPSVSSESHRHRPSPYPPRRANAVGRPLRGSPPHQLYRGRNGAPFPSRSATEPPPKRQPHGGRRSLRVRSTPLPPPAPASAPLCLRRPPRTRRLPSVMAPRSPPASLTHRKASTHPIVGDSHAHDAVRMPLPPPPHSHHPHLPANSPPKGPPTATTPPFRQNRTPLSEMGCCRARLADTCQSSRQVPATCVPHKPSPPRTGRAGRGAERHARERGKVPQYRAACARRHVMCAPLCGRSGRRRYSAAPARARGRGRR